MLIALRTGADLVPPREMSQKAPAIPVEDILESCLTLWSFAKIVRIWRQSFE